MVIQNKDFENRIRNKIVKIMEEDNESGGMTTPEIIGAFNKQKIKHRRFISQHKLDIIMSGNPDFFIVRRKKQGRKIWGLRK